MSIQYLEHTGLLVLETANTAYHMKIDGCGCLQHLYYGAKSGKDDLSYTMRAYDRGFSGNPYDMRDDRSFSLDTLPQEYTSYGVGDFRINSIAVTCPDGSRCAEFRYEGHEITDGKYSIPGLPSVYDPDGSAQTLTVILADAVSGIRVRLRYGVFEDLDIITRSAEIINGGDGTVILEKASSVCLDMPPGEWDMIHFHGRHCMERQPERVSLFHGVHSLSSGRGMSSHQHNPFVILCDRKATEDSGICCGMMLMYSGNHKTEIELDQFGRVRAVMGLNDDHFSWELPAGSSFHTPEVILTCAEGLTQLSHNYHRVIRGNVVRGEYKYAHRPVLVNNWEATYFDFNEAKLLDIAARARDLGIEMFVLDDGWFRNRNDDRGGLGDWVTDTRKLPEGLGGLINRIKAMGLKFGLWIEPEMVSEDSELFRTHPEWALTVPGRAPMMARDQLVLDLSNREVIEYLYTTIAGLLSRYDIDYIKWDFNRPVSDVYSDALPPSRQGEVLHRYYLGLYELYDRLTAEFPHVLFEGCSGGGGRYDAGMLQYSPQIWCSDNTDPISRLTIQYGTSFGYPASTMGAHVSASPNHQTGRATPLSVRGITAMAGVLGYEIDLTRLTDEECGEIREQIRRYKEIEHLVHDGRFYRLSKADSCRYAAWAHVSEDKSRCVLSIVVKDPQANGELINIRLKGLDPDAVYSAGGEFVCEGRTLMNRGYTFRRLTGDHPAIQIDIVKREAVR